ncbi:hypothetical protein GALMADRAFT_220416 [Galerina marginata CBS 339.88]|uniref:Uncharacterized protein n=1 Tax=Galerina marginata (strain CBS 339.88) TaxID=685588 RepID=A0A067TH06_GALM3|nr:hypothetical protein GALMADRAFT_220416 [Galerina marginata CBS 339.88]
MDLLQMLTVNVIHSLTVTMMSRITLNLRKSVSEHDTAVRAEMPSMFTQRSQVYTNHPIKIVGPGFNDFDLNEDERQFPMISIANPRKNNTTSTTNLDSEVSSTWGNTWSAHPNYHDPIQEIESGENVRFQARTTLDSKGNGLLYQSHCAA